MQNHAFENNKQNVPRDSAFVETAICVKPGIKIKRVFNRYAIFYKRLEIRFLINVFENVN